MAREPSPTQILLTPSDDTIRPCRISYDCKGHCGKILLGVTLLGVVDDLDVVETVGFLVLAFNVNPPKIS